MQKLVVRIDFRIENQIAQSNFLSYLQFLKLIKLIFYQK